MEHFSVSVCKLPSLVIVLNDDLIAFALMIRRTLGSWTRFSRKKRKIKKEKLKFVGGGAALSLYK